MKFLDAQKQHQDKKNAEPHANKMMGGAEQNKAGQPIVQPNQHGKQRSPITHDDASALAKSLGIDLSKVTGTGPGGQILPRDVRRFAEEQKTKTAPDTK